MGALWCLWGVCCCVFGLFVMAFLSCSSGQLLGAGNCCPPLKTYFHPLETFVSYAVCASLLWLSFHVAGLDVTAEM